MSHIFSPSLSVTEDLGICGRILTVTTMWGVQPAVWSANSAQEEDVFIKYLATNCPWKSILPGPCPTQFWSFLLMRFRGCDAIQKLWRITSWDSLKQKWKRCIRMNTVETLHKLFIGEDAPLPSTSPDYHILFHAFICCPGSRITWILLLAGVAHPNKYLYSLNICLYKYTYFYI